MYKRQKLRLYLLEDLTDRLVERLRANRLDAILLGLPCACGGADVMPLLREEFLAALPPGHHLARLEEIPPALLATERLLLLEEGHCLRDQALDICGFARGTGPEEADGFAATSLHTLVQMVAGGLGITVLPRLAVQAGVAAGTDITLRRIAGNAHRTLGLAWRPNAPRMADYQALAPLIRQASLAG